MIVFLAFLQLGFDSLFFARIDYQDRAKRLREKTLEVVWQGSKSLGSSSQVICLMILCLQKNKIFFLLSFFLHHFLWLTSFQIFTGIFPRHYDPPDGFVFEINDVSEPIQVEIFYLRKSNWINRFNILFPPLLRLT